MKQISVPDAVPGPRWACAHRPLAELSANKLAAQYTNKSEGQWTFLNVHHTHARTWSLHAFVRARSLRLCPRVSPFFFIFIAERNTDVVVDKISALAKRRRVYLNRWKYRSKLRHVKENSIVRDRWDCRISFTCRIFPWSKNDTRYYENSWHKSLWKFRVAMSWSKNEGVILQWHAM